MPSKIFLDASFVLEILLQRKNIDQCLNIIAVNEKIYISPLIVHLVFYFGIKAKLDFEYCINFINQFNILVLDENSVFQAQQICKDQDFEDALQIACAIYGDCNLVYTLDQRLYNNYHKIINISMI